MPTNRDLVIAFAAGLGMWPALTVGNWVLAVVYCAGLTAWVIRLVRAGRPR